jgi:hypothetical protein
VTLLYFAFKGANIPRMWDALKNAEYSWVILTMVLGFLTFISRGYRWLILLETMGYGSKVANSVNAVTIGYLVNLALPRLGEFTRCTALNRVEKIPIGKLFGTILVERAIDMMILLFLLALTLFTNLDTFGGFFYDVFGTKLQRTSNLIGYAFLLLVLAGSVLFLVYRYRKKLMRNRFFFKVFSVYRSIGHGFRTIFAMERKGLFFLHTVFIWCMYFLMTYLCFFSFDATEGFGLDKGLFVMTAGGLGMAAPTQGGIGAYHWMVTKALEEIDISYEMGLAFATVTHSSQVLMIVLTGTVALFLWYRAVKKQRGVDEPLAPWSKDFSV